MLSQRQSAAHQAACRSKAQARPRVLQPPARSSVVANAVASKLAAANKVKLGDSDLLVSECCLGTMTWGKQNTEAQAHQQLSYAFDQGINWFDTAEMYPVPPAEITKGLTDRFIGSWLKKKKREDVVVATKVAGYSETSTWLREPKTTVRLNKEQIKASVEGSLERLQTDHIDLLQLHWPDRYVPLFGSGAFDKERIRPDFISFEEQLRALQDLVKEGKVRYIGVSNETSYGVSEFLHLAKSAGLPKIQTIQNGYSLLNRGQYETNLAETCYYGNVSLMVYSPLAGGALSAKYNHGDVPNGRFNLFPGYMARYNASRVKEAVGEYEKIAKKHGMSCTQMALAWTQSRWFVTATIIGATSVDQLKENIAAFDKKLSPECLAEIEEVFKVYRDPTLF